ncbi:LPD23 domain-containing protein [Campylobacter sp. CX2-4080-23]|uniref:putative barnase/colicin E5 family endoribonuclease n=1 Tax=Campylobacter porcelli TaxID=1660073 RepID=UPI002E9BBABD|nr:LPD23 domain-containing protein [Campylobacter sp. CX2-4080-23]
MRANFIVEKIKPLIPRLGNNEALKLHLNRAILNANGDFKLAIKNIDDIPDGNLLTPTRNLLNEFKNALKDIEQVVKSQANEPTQIKAENQVNLSKTKEPTQEPVKAEAKKEAENLAQYRKDIEAKYNINPIKEFGTNYAEFYHDGKNAIRKLLVERQGQVAGAFERKELGDIDLVWGEAKAANGDIKGYGLSKIEAKHLNDFASFYGDTPQEKLINGLNEIIKNGKIINENGVDTIWYKKDNDYYLIGLSKGFYNKGDNNWIITVYEKTNLSIDKKARIDKALKGGDSKTISAYAEIKSSKTPKLTTAENSTTTANKSQAKNMMGGFSTMAMEKAILHLGSGAIGGAINANAEQDPDKKAEAFLKGFLLGAGGSVAAIKTLESSAKLAPQLARISQRLANDLPVILNDRPDIVGKALGKSPKDNYNYIFGGENAIGANKAKLKTAREMAKNGVDESQIWAKTGWYKDIDKKWKFEINPLGGKFKKAIKDLFDAKAFKEKNREKLEVLQDRAKINDKYQTNLNNLNATLSQQASIITKAKDGLKLSEVLDDKKLFNAYPQLRDLKVRFDELDSQMSMYDGYYNKTLDEIVLNSKLYNKPEMLRSILYHEIQHKIQSIEGFASGGGYFSDITKVEKLLEKYPNDADLQNLYDGLKYNYVSDSAEYNVYRKLAGEAEARNVQTRLTANSKEHPNKTLDINPNERIVKFDSDMSASYTPNSSVLKEQKDKLGIELANMDEKAQADTIKLYENAKSADEKHNALKMAMLSNRSDEFRPISHVNLSDISDKEAQDLAKKYKNTILVLILVFIMVENIIQ